MWTGCRPSFYEERNIYRLKDRALARFAKAYFKAGGRARG